MNPVTNISSEKLQKQLSDLFNRREKSKNSNTTSQLSSYLMQSFYDEVMLQLGNFSKNSSVEEKGCALFKLLDAINIVEVYESPKVLAEDLTFHRFTNDLFSFIQDECPKAKIKTLLDPKLPSSPLAEIIANMSPHKADSLLEILSKGSDAAGLQKDLKTLYLDNPKSTEAQNFSTFLQEHQIDFLGGINSKNFKVTQNLSGATQVLKVDNRLALPRHVIYSLRKQLKDLFIAVYVERQAVAKVWNKETNGYKFISSTLVVSDYCEEGSLNSYAQRMHMNGFTKTLQSAADIGIKMAQVYLELQALDAFFPDSKISNFLVKNNKLIIADTKSFLWSYKGIYSKNHPNNKKMSLLKTRGFGFDLDFNSVNIPVEPAHVRLLARNLFAYLMNEGKGFPPNEDLQEVHFNDPFFTGNEKGQKFKDLILALSKATPAIRMPLEEVQKQLALLAGFCTQDNLLIWALEHKHCNLIIYLTNKDENAPLIAALSRTQFYTLLNFLGSTSPNLFSRVLKNPDNKYFKDGKDYSGFSVSDFKKDSLKILVNWILSKEKSKGKSECLRHLLLNEGLKVGDFESSQAFSIKDFCHLIDENPALDLFIKFLDEAGSYTEIETEIKDPTHRLLLNIYNKENDTVERLLKEIKINAIENDQFLILLSYISQMPTKIFNKLLNARNIIVFDKGIDLENYLKTWSLENKSALLNWANKNQKKELAANLIACGVQDPRSLKLTFLQEAIQPNDEALVHDLLSDSTKSTNEPFFKVSDDVNLIPNNPFESNPSKEPLTSLIIQNSPLQNHSDLCFDRNENKLRSDEMELKNTELQQEQENLERELKEILEAKSFLINETLIESFSTLQERCLKALRDNEANPNPNIEAALHGLEKTIEMHQAALRNFLNNRNSLSFSIIPQILYNMEMKIGERKTAGENSNKKKNLEALLDSLKKEFSIELKDGESLIEILNKEDAESRQKFNTACAEKRFFSLFAPHSKKEGENLCDQYLKQIKTFNP